LVSDRSIALVVSGVSGTERDPHTVVGTLHTALLDDSEATLIKAGEVLRTLVNEILLTPEAGDFED
jgi:hypothetical protein